jgi:hypothetical protein
MSSAEASHDAKTTARSTVLLSFRTFLPDRRHQSRRGDGEEFQQGICLGRTARDLFRAVTGLCDDEVSVVTTPSANEGAFCLGFLIKVSRMSSTFARELARTLGRAADAK